MTDAIPFSPRGHNLTEDKIFFWLDILGFSNFLEDEAEYRNLADLLQRFQGLFNEIDELDSTIISDGIVLSLKQNLYRSDFINVCQKIAEKQVKFALDTHRFIRGGIAVGSKLDLEGELARCKHCKSERSFISNGLARAYNIESSRVDWPVVGTHQKEFQRIKSFYKIEDDDSLGLAAGVNYRGEPLFYIDYLKDRPELRHVIETNKQAFINEKKPRIWCKYEWLLQQYEANNESVASEVQDDLY